jgi:hypothetical protein
VSGCAAFEESGTTRFGGAAERSNELWAGLKAEQPMAQRQPPTSGANCQRLQCNAMQCNAFSLA